MRRVETKKELILRECTFDVLISGMLIQSRPLSSWDENKWEVGVGTVGTQCRKRSETVPSPWPLLGHVHVQCVLDRRSDVLSCSCCSVETGA